jgi:hypothetical protein
MKIVVFMIFNINLNDFLIHYIHCNSQKNNHMKTMHRFIDPLSATRLFSDFVLINGYLGAVNGRCLIVDEVNRDNIELGGLVDVFDLLTLPKNESAIPGALDDIQHDTNLKWRDFPELPLIGYKECQSCEEDGCIPESTRGCDECDSVGELSFSNSKNEYTVTCLSCDGDGNAHTGKYVSCKTCYGTKKNFSLVPSIAGNEKYCLNAQVIPLFDAFSNVKIAWHEKSSMFAVKFDGGYGVISPMTYE